VFMVDNFYRKMQMNDTICSMIALIQKRIFLAVIVLLVILLGIYLILRDQELVSIEAAWTSPAELMGHLYAAVQNSSSGSRQGMGWISLNCKTGGPAGEDICSSMSNYKVVINNDTNRTLTGYAWGGNVASINGQATGLGWLRFGGLANCPGGGTAADCAARVVGSDANGYELSGWARACSVFADANSCSGALADDASVGGWDGWVSLNCDNHAAGTCVTYRVTIDSAGRFGTGSNGTAWGDVVLGAVSFARAGIDLPDCGTETIVCNGSDLVTTGYNIWCEPAPAVTTSCTNGCNVTTGGCVGAPSEGGLSVSDTVVRRDAVITIGWDIPTAGNCTVTGPHFTETGLVGSYTVIITQNQSTFILTCDGVVIDSELIRLLPDVYES
jgi:hypothetical protein